MEIVHFRNVAGVSTTLAKYQRKIGHRAKVLVQEPHPFGYPGETVYTRTSRKLLHGLTSVLSANVVHYHEGPYLVNLPRRYSRLAELDYKVAKRLKKRMVFHFHGGEVREPARRAASERFFSEKILVATPDLLKFVPKHAIWLPYPVDTELFFPNRKETTDTLRIGYYEPVTDYVRLFTPGRELIEGAIEGISGTEIKLSPAQKTPWKDMPAYFNGIDIWIDKIRINFYGLAAAEASACQIPVITQIGEQEMSYLPDCPFINTKPESLKDAIEYLCEENTRKYVARKCFDYVGRIHRASDAVQRLDEIYRS